MRPTIERARECVRYDADKGVFYWIARNSKRIKIGDVAGSKMSNGYINLRIDQRQVLGHHLAYAFVHGEYPAWQVDHRNRIRDDNRIDNLRVATRSQNMRNAAKPRHGRSSRFKGVSWSDSRLKWRAQICFDKKRTYLGDFLEEEQAAAAYDWCAVSRFGEFANPNGEVIVL